MNIKFNDTLQGISPLWQAAENYLNVGYLNYKVVAIKDNEIEVTNCKNDSTYLITVLKVISYFSVVLPLIAMIIKYSFRKNMSVTIKNSSNIDDYAQLKENIIAFNQKYETGAKKQAEKYKDGLKYLYKRFQDIKPSLKAEDLDKYLLSLPTYFESQNQVLDHLYSALLSLIEHSNDADAIKNARTVYKAISTFLRRETKPEHFKTYERYLTDIALKGSTGAHKPACYLAHGFSTDEHEQNHAALIFLLKHLRKRIKLATKQDKIIAEIEKDPNLKADPKKIFEALHCTFLHGTKVSVIKSCCEKSNGELLCFGELKKKKIDLLTGELTIGALECGLNITSISGVNLLSAQHCLPYANRYQFNLDNAKEKIQWILEKKFVDWNDFWKGYGWFGSCVESLKMVHSHNPKEFEKNKEALTQKLGDIYSALKTHVFDRRPTEFFAYDSDYYTSWFYSFLKNLEDFETLLNTPVQEEIKSDEEDLELAAMPLVMASTNTYGIPRDMSCVREHFEELYPGNLKLGKNLTLLFAYSCDIDKVKSVVKDYNLVSSVKVESIEFLLQVAKVDQHLETYFYDSYGIKKWRTALQKH